MRKIAIAFIFLILLTNFNLVVAKPIVQNWCFNYSNGFVLCGERKVIIVEIINDDGQQHYNYKENSKYTIYDVSGQICNIERTSVRHNYLYSDGKFITRILSFYQTLGINFNNCTFDFSNMMLKYNSEGLQFCKGDNC